MKKSLILMMVLMVLLIGTVSAGGQQDVADDDGVYKFAWVVTSNVDESMKWFTKNAEAKAAELGVELVMFDPNGDVQRQANMKDR